MARRLSRSEKEKKEKKVREKPKYFEGILQIRNPNDKIMSFVLNEFEKSTHYFSRIEKVKGGYDLYSSSNKFSRKVGQKLYTEFGGELKESAQLFTQNKLTSKEVFRLNVMYRAPDYLPGDILFDGKNVFVVTSMRKDKILGIDLVSRKKINIDMKAEIEKLTPQKTTISRLKPSAEALDPETYQSLEIENPIRGLKIGQEVHVVKVKGHLYMISI